MKPFIYMGFLRSVALAWQVFWLRFVHISESSKVEFTSLRIGANEVDASP